MRSAAARVHVVVYADHRSIGLRRQPLLDGGIVFHRAMAVEMVLGDIEQNAHSGVQRGCKIDLVGRNLQHINAARRKRLERQHRNADIAAHLRVAASAVDQMRDQRGGGRLAVGASDCDERRFGPSFRRSRQNNSMSPMTSTPPGAQAQPTNAASDASAVRPAPAPMRRLATNRACANPACSARRLSPRPRSFHYRRKQQRRHRPR